MNEFMKDEIKHNFCISYHSSPFLMNTQMTVTFVHTNVWEGGFAHKNMNNDVFKICSFRENVLPRLLMNSKG